MEQEKKPIATDHVHSDFSDSERDALLEVAKQKVHRKWLIDGLKTWAQWIGALLVAWKLGSDFLESIIKALKQ